jgi:26S proteasome regulatory subunit N4
LLKFNDDLTLDYFQDDDENASKFVIFPGSFSPNLIPEDLEDEELSDYEEEEDDEDDDVFNLNNTTELSSFGHMDTSPSRLPKDMFQDSAIADNNNSLDIESDVDKMSLVSSDDDNNDDDDDEEEEEYSSNSSVIDEDFETVSPSFNIVKKKPFLQATKKSSSFNNNLSAPPIVNKIRKSSMGENPDSTMTMAADSLNQHQCHLMNPSTGKECLKQFSRPYDLIRHQETIHAERKKIFRCIVCNKIEGGLSKKTFSRGDALSRHVRVKHGLNGDEAADAVKFAKDHVEYL